MKRTGVSIAAAIMVSLAGCRKTDDTPRVLENIQDKCVTSLTGRVTDEGMSTKSSVDAAGKYLFLKGESISVFDSDGGNHKFTSTDSGSSVSFTTEDAIQIGNYSIMPYSNTAAVSGDSVFFSLPYSYDHVEWQSNMPMLGKISSYDEDSQSATASFKAIGAVLELSIYSVPEDATSMTFTTPNNKICGDFTIPDASLETCSIGTSEAEGLDNQLVFNFTRHKNMTFYIPLPTGTIQGFRIAFNDAANTTRSVGKAIQLERNHFVLAPALNLGDDTAWVQHPMVSDGNRISRIIWKGMYGKDNVTTYTFKYDDQSRMTYCSMDDTGCVVSYPEDGTTVFSVNGYDYSFRTRGFTCWMQAGAAWYPLFQYNYDGTLCCVWDYGFSRPGSSDSIWDGGHDVVNLAGEETITYSGHDNPWCGVSLNTFIFMQPPGFTMIVGDMGALHTAHVPAAVSDGSNTVTIDVEYDTDGRIVSGKLTGGWRDGESFMVYYDDKYTGAAGVCAVEAALRLADGAPVSSTTTFTDAVVTRVYGDRAWIEDSSGAIVLNKSGHGLKTSDRLSGQVDFIGKMNGDVPELTGLSGFQVTQGGAYDGTVITLDRITVSHLNRLVHIQDVTVLEGFDSAWPVGRIQDGSGSTFPICPVASGITMNASATFTDLWAVPSIENDALVLLFIP